MGRESEEVESLAVVVGGQRLRFLDPAERIV